MPIKNDREYRNMVEVEIKENEDDRMIVRGYASTFNEPYTLYEDDDHRVKEVVDSEAFRNTDMRDVIMQYDHMGRVFARTSNNTLTVTPDERGLLIEADLGGTELGRQLYEEIKGGYTNKMSFGFKVDSDKRTSLIESDGKNTVVRRITDVRKLYDVSAVSIPANDATSISVRSLTDGLIEEIQAERLEAEKRERAKEALELKIKIMEVEFKHES